MEVKEKVMYDLSVIYIQVPHTHTHDTPHTVYKYTTLF